MIYKLKTKGGQEIPLRDAEAVRKILEAANGGKVRLLVTEYGIVDVSSIDSITPHKDMNRAIAEMNGYGNTGGTAFELKIRQDEAIARMLGESPLAEIIGQGKAISGQGTGAIQSPVQGNGLYLPDSK